MSASNHRNKDYETFHHLTSRIAHQVFFLKEDERNDFVFRMLRVAEFSGIRLIGWCAMTNHFHILAYLPTPKALDEDEILRRYSLLKSSAEFADLQTRIAMWRKMPGGESLVEETLGRIKARMYSIGEFMKTLKQWMTEDYNRRYAHRGTLWEATYHDRIVKGALKDLSETLGYIHLNPIRAAASAGFDDYQWSSFTAFRKGDATAVAGMRLVYGDDATVDDMRSSHIALLDGLLEYEKRKRAEEVARKRGAGYDIPHDHLTDESMVAQAAAHLELVRREAVEIESVGRITKRTRGRPAVTGGERESAILRAIMETPSLSIPALAAALKVPVSTIYENVRKLKRRGVLSQSKRGAAWTILNYG